MKSTGNAKIQKNNINNTKIIQKHKKYKNSKVLKHLLKKYKEHTNKKAKKNFNKKID